MFLYQIVNKVSGNKYYGIAVNTRKRMYVHKHCWKNGTKSPLYDAMRKYGWDSFELEVLEEGAPDYIAAKEIELIASDPNCYNLHLGGHIGFSMTRHGKTDEEVALWRARLRNGRKGKTPALGMRHTEETKKLCAEYGKLRWDIHGRYPAEVLSYSFAEANRRYGISKTHYYRLRKSAAE